MDKLAQWLAQLGLQAYQDSFAKNDIDWDILPELTDDDLKELGVTSLGHRKKLFRAIADLACIETHADPQIDALSRAERRQLTVMFCDLVDSTALSVQLDPEDLRDVISAYQDCCQPIVERFGGHVARFMGDGILIYFGYPRADEHDSERAVRAALGIIAAVGQLQVAETTRLQTRIGIATGEVVVGDLIGTGAAQEESVVGETPNLAARLQSLAEPDSVVISAMTQRLIGGLFEYRDLGQHVLKGFTEPVYAWQVLGERTVESRLHAQIAQALETHFATTIDIQPELLAHHYTGAGLHEPAIAYWLQAGQRALQNSAHVEAIDHLQQGLGLLQHIPDLAQRDQHELQLQTMLGPAFLAIKGFASEEVETAYTRARTLCAQSGDNNPQLFPVLRGLMTFYINRADYQTALQLSQPLRTLAEHDANPGDQLEVHWTLGSTLLFKGDFVQARPHLEQGRQLYDPQQHRQNAFIYGQDPGRPPVWQNCSIAMPKRRELVRYCSQFMTSLAKAWILRIYNRPKPS